MYSQDLIWCTRNAHTMRPLRHPTITTINKHVIELEIFNFMSELLLVYEAAATAIPSATAGAGEIRFCLSLSSLVRLS